MTAYYDKNPYRGYELQVSAARTFNKVDQSFVIVIEGITATGTYALDWRQGRKVFFSDYTATHTQKAYRNSVSNSSSLMVTRLDTVGKGVSGTFSGVLYNTEDSSDSIQIREGRFDARLRY